jgi:hypothetical protein
VKTHPPASQRPLKSRLLQGHHVLTPLASEQHIELPHPGTYLVNSVRSSVQVHSRDLLGRRPCSAVFRLDAGTFTVTRPPSDSTLQADLTLDSSRAPQPLGPRAQVVETIAPVTATFQSVSLQHDITGWTLHGDPRAASSVAPLVLSLQRLVLDADVLHIVANATLNTRGLPTLPGWPTSRRRLLVIVDLSATIQPTPDTRRSSS